MINNDQFNTNLNWLKKEGAGSKLRKTFKLGLRNWWLFALSFVILFSLVFLYLRYEIPTYRINAKILAADEGNKPTTKAEDIDEYNIALTQPTVDNEIEILKGRSLLENTIKQLQLNLDFYAEGKISAKEIYSKFLPFTLKADVVNEDYLVNTKILYTRYNENFFSLKYKDSITKHHFGDTVHYDFGNLIIQTANPAKTYSPTLPVIIKISKMDDAVASYQKALTIDRTTKFANTISLSFTDKLPQRGEDFLNTLLSLYSFHIKQEKDRLADSSIAFIDDRLAFVRSELGDVERQMQDFRQANEITDISAQGKLLLDNSSSYRRDLTQQQVQLEVVNNLENYLMNEKNSNRIVPTTIAIQDPTFIALVQNYNTLQSELDQTLQTTAENNPIAQKIRSQIANLRKDILANLKNMKAGMQIAQNEITKRSEGLNAQIQQVPKKEKAFLEFSRQQNIKEELYLFLLKRREAAAVSKSNNVTRSTIIDYARSEAKPFFPPKMIFYLAAFIPALIIPSSIVYLKLHLSDKIHDKNEVLSSTDVPVIGDIFMSKKHNLTLSPHDNNAFSEQFRRLRTNLDFISASSGQLARTILITSSMRGEGKSFVAANLAAILAETGKKSILIEFDLRKSSLSKLLNLESNEGVTTYVIKKKSLDSLIQAVPGFDNMSFMSAGLMPPNPVNIILNPNVSLLFEALKEKYDHVIVDAPPVGIITDAQILQKYSDINLFIIRESYTFKHQLGIIQELYEKERFKNLAIVYNGLRMEKKAGYSYGSY